MARSVIVIGQDGWRLLCLALPCLARIDGIATTAGLVAMGDNVCRVVRDTVLCFVFLANVVLARVSLCCKLFGLLMVVLLFV